VSTLTADPKFARGHVLGINYSYFDTENNPQDLQIGTGQGVKGVHSVFRDENPHDGSLQSNLTVECVAVKNVGADPIAAGATVKLNPLKGLGETGGAVAELYGIVDEWLTAPVKSGEVCWVVVRGPSAAVVAGDDPATGKTVASKDVDGAAVSLTGIIVVGSDAHGM
jgi:hypothetical protein